MIVLHWVKYIFIGPASGNPRGRGYAKGWWSDHLGAGMTVGGSGVEKP
jgi:hypothetical protein